MVIIQRKKVRGDREIVVGWHRCVDGRKGRENLSSTSLRKVTKGTNRKWSEIEEEIGNYWRDRVERIQID